MLSIYGFKFPLLVSLCHQAFSFVTLAPIMCTSGFRDLHMTSLSKQWLGLLGVAICFAVNVGFNNVSLLAISLSLNQIIRALIPVVTAVGSIFIEKRSLSRKEFVSLAVLFGGVAISVYEGSNTRGSLAGVASCLVGTICNGLMMAASGRLMSEKMDVLRLTFYTAPVCCFVLVPFYWQLEYNEFQKYANASSSAYLGLLLLGCLNALAYNIVHYLLIKFTSSVTTTVLGEMKIVLILVLSAFMLGESRIWSLQMLLGCTTAILGFCMYSHCQLAATPTQWQPVIKGVPELSPSLTDPLRSPLLTGNKQNII